MEKECLIKNAIALIATIGNRQVQINYCKNCNNIWCDKIALAKAQSVLIGDL